MKDLNECGLKPRPCKHRCMNTAGSYKCYCVDGYAPQPHGSCRNAQTCYHANCQYGCEVIKGAVRCTCPSPGLRLGPDRCTCVDVNECVLGGGVCPRCRKCVNTFGSFLCKCHLGFKLVYINGRYTCVVPRYPSNNQVWEFDVELGNTARDDPGGRYLSVPELKVGQRSIRGARLAVQIVPPWRHSDLCFSFSHWLTGHHVGMLQLFIRKKGHDQRYSPALWSRTGGHDWRRTQVTLATNSLDRIFGL
uniref:nephronectin-like isoform X7 n=1 Tax=Monopterus albus TaxID=43700 RepID=UPI0009B4BA05|nr:nephronectin-like isoform X7 [Monopterus albus]